MERSQTHSKAAGTPSPWFVAGLILAGFIHCCIFFWLVWRHPFRADEMRQYISGLAGIFPALLASLVPPINKFVNDRIQKSNSVLRNRGRKTATLIILAVAVLLLLQAYLTRDRLLVAMNDEHSYRIGAQMLARGRLWMPPYPSGIGDFFDAVSMITDRVYASMYFPGTALIHTPGVLPGLPDWMTSLMVASIAAGLVYLLLARLLDPSRAILGVLLLASNPTFREWSLELMSSVPTMAWTLLLLLAWLNFRDNWKLRWAALVGLAASFLAITRPLDAICLALPVGIAILYELRNQPRRLILSIAIILIAALPLLGLQVIQNIGVTGSWRDFPETYYNRLNFPASPFGFQSTSFQSIPVPPSPPKQQWVATWVLPYFHRHTLSRTVFGWYPQRLRDWLESILPNPLLSLLIFPAFCVIRGAGRTVWVLGLVLFSLVYPLYVFPDARFAMPIAPIVIGLVMMGWQAIEKTWPSRTRWNTCIALTIIFTSIWQWPPLTSIPSTSDFAAEQRLADRVLSGIRAPALVLFRFNPAIDTFHDDPVYNDTVAWPDDALIVRAHDLGWQKDRELFQYYAQTEPNRVVFLYDSAARLIGADPLRPPLGTVAQLAAIKN